MGERDEPVIRPAEERAIGGEREACNDDGKEQRQRHDIEAEALDGDQREIVEAPMECQNQPDEQQRRREIERVIDHEAKGRRWIEREELEAEDPDLVLLLAVGW